MVFRSSASALGLTVGKTTSILRAERLREEGWASADTDGTGVVTLLVSGVVYSLPELYEAGVGVDEESDISRRALGGRPLGHLDSGIEDKDGAGEDTVKYSVSLQDNNPIIAPMF